MLNDKINEWMNLFPFYIKLSGMCSQWAYVCEWKESSSHGPTEVLWWGECINHPPEWCMLVFAFLKLIFSLIGFFILSFFVSCKLLKTAAWKVLLCPVWLLVSFFFFDGLIVQASFVQSSFYVQSIEIIVLL